MRNEKRSGSISLIAAIFLIVGICVTIFGVYSLINGGKQYRGYKKVTAEVVEAYYPENAEGTAAICVYEMNGRSYNYGHASKKHLEVGDKVTLYCSSDAPSRPVPSIIDTDALVIVFMGAGVAVIGLFIAMLSGGKGVGGASLSGIETNAGKLMDGLEALLDETYEDDDEDEDDDDGDDEDDGDVPDTEPALSDIEKNAEGLVNGLEAILNETYEDEPEEPEETELEAEEESGGQE